MKVAFKSWHELDEQDKWVVQLMEDNLPPVLQTMILLGHTEIWQHFALHQPDGSGFILYSLPDGPYVCVQPVNDDAQALMPFPEPDDRGLPVPGLTEWAMAQTWALVLGVHLRETEPFVWEFVGPKGEVING